MDGDEEGVAGKRTTSEPAQQLAEKGLCIVSNGTIGNAQSRHIEIFTSHYARSIAFGSDLNGQTIISGGRVQSFAMVSAAQRKLCPLYPESSKADAAAQKAFRILFDRIEDICFAALEIVWPGKFKREEVKVDEDFVAYLYNNGVTQSAQLVHADSGSKYNFRALLYLSSIQQVTHFVPYHLVPTPLDKDGEPINMSFLDKRSNKKNQFISSETIEAYAARFSLMLLPDLGNNPPVPQTQACKLTDDESRKIFVRLHTKILHAMIAQKSAIPIDDGVKLGDLLLFAGDLLHMGEILTKEEQRLLMFIPVTVVGTYGGDRQLHPICLSEYIHGRHSPDNIETIFAFMVALEFPLGQTIDIETSRVVSHSGDYNSFPQTVKNQLKNMKRIYQKGYKDENMRAKLDAKLKEEREKGEW